MNELQDKSIEELIELQGKITDLIAEKQKEKKEELKQMFQDLAGEAGLTVDEILNPKAKKEPKKVKPKYEKDGQTWSGRGRVPAWVKEVEEAGGSREDYLIQD